MQTFNLAIDYSDLMDEKERETTNNGKMLENVKQIVENSILSSLEDVQLPTKDGPKRFIRGLTQRKVDRILDQLDDCEDGILTMPPKRAKIFQEMWTDRLAGPAAGNHRKLMQRIDRVICPEAYKKDDDDDDQGSTDDANES